MTTKQPDWEAIERAYRAGLLSIREIASTQGITHGAINKRAKRDGWERDLKAKIQAKADSLVSKRTVSTEVAAEGIADKELSALLARDLLVPIFHDTTYESRAKSVLYSVREAA